jgi:hypothetical protein
MYRESAPPRGGPAARTQVLPGASSVSPATQQTVDDEVRRIVEEAERP